MPHGGAVSTSSTARCGLVHAEGTARVPTVAGLLLLGTEAALRKHLVTHEVLFQVLDGEDVKVNDSHQAPLLRVFERIEEQLKLRNEQEETQVGLFRVPIPTVDVRAFREAVLNAFVHRDYSRMGAIHVQWKSESIEVSNPGGFVEGVTLDNLLVTPPHPRNRCLADALKRIGLVERTGRGVDLIFAGVLRYGRPAPDYSRSTSTSVVVVLSHGEADVAFLRMILDEEKRRGASMPVPALIALAQIRKERRCDVHQIARAIQRSESDARSVIERLVEVGLVEARGEKRGRVYILSRSVYQATEGAEGYRKQRGLDPEQQRFAILEHLRANGTIRRADVLELCKLNDGQATRLLARLVKDGLLVRSGTRRGAVYRAKSRR